LNSNISIAIAKSREEIQDKNATKIRVCQQGSRRSLYLALFVRYRHSSGTD
jgi:hypothetical protein